MASPKPLDSYLIPGTAVLRNLLGITTSDELSAAEAAPREPCRVQPRARLLDHVGRELRREIRDHALPCPRFQPHMLTHQAGGDPEQPGASIDDREVVRRSLFEGDEERLRHHVLGTALSESLHRVAVDRRRMSIEEQCERTRLIRRTFDHLVVCAHVCIAHSSRLSSRSTTSTRSDVTTCRRGHLADDDRRLSPHERERLPERPRRGAAESEGLVLSASRSRG